LRQFTSKLVELLESVANNSVLTSEEDIEAQKLVFANNIWVLNDIVIPFTGNGPQFNFFRLKYSPPENYLATYGHLNKQILSSINEKLITSSPSTPCHSNFSLDINRRHIIDADRQQPSFSRYNIITNFACNKQGKRSAPLVLLPRYNDLEPDLASHVLYNHLHFEETTNGDFNELKSFIQWLHRYL